MAISVTDKCKLRNKSPNTIRFCLENDSSIHRISFVVFVTIVSSFFATCILLVQNTIENYNLEGESRNFQSHSDGNGGMNVVLSSHLVTMLLL